MQLLNEERLKPEQVAGLIGVSRKTVMDWKRAGKLPKPLTVGKKSYWFKSQIEEWLAKKNPHLADAANQVVSSVAPELAAQ